MASSRDAQLESSGNYSIYDDAEILKQSSDGSLSETVQSDSNVAAHAQSLIITLPEDISLDAEESRAFISKCREALSGPLRDRFPDEVHAFCSMGDGVLAVYQGEETLEQLCHSFILYREALRLAVPDDPCRPWAIRGLGYAFTLRSERFGTSNDLEEGVRLLRAAVRLCPDGHQYRALCLEGLGSGLFRRYAQHGERDDLNEAIQAHTFALALRGAGDKDRFESLTNLANAVVARYDNYGDAKDLERTIELHRETLQLLGPGNRNRYVALNNVASALYARFERLGTIADLDEAILLHRECVDILPDAHPNRGGALVGLGVDLHARFTQLGAMDDLEDAIRLHREAVRLLKGDGGHPAYPAALHNLANDLQEKFDQLGHLDDLNEAIELNRESLALRPPGHADRSDALHNLALVLRMRFKRNGSLADLEEAITAHRQALEMYDAGNTDRPSALDNLGLVLEARFGVQHELHDLEEAIQLYEEALVIRSPGTPGRSASLSHLSSAYVSRFHHSGGVQDATSALTFMKEALDDVEEGRSDRADYLFSLSSHYLDRRSPHHDLPTAISLISDAVADNRWNAQLRLTRAIKRLEDIQAHEQIADAVRAALLHVQAQTVRLLPRVAYFGLDLRSRLQALRRGENVAATAAANALILEQPTFALELLEEGRAVFWTQALSLRTPFDELPPRLRDNLLRLSKQLERDSYTAQDGSKDEPNKEVIEEDAARRRRESEEFNALVVEVRSLPGFERFLLPNDFALLAKAAEKGPVVVLSASTVACNALLVQPSGEVSRLPLPDVSVAILEVLGAELSTANRYSRELFDEDRAMKKIRTQATNTPEEPTARDILQKLWEGVVKPVIDALNMKPSSGRERPRLWWCPTGPFAFLPIHAAGVYTPGGQCCSDYVVSSYTPTLSALLTARRHFSPVARADAKLLLAGVPHPFKGQDLPSTVAEVRAIASIVPPTALLPLPAGDDAAHGAPAGASVSAVLGALPHAALVHLASHGWQDPHDALGSGFVLRDGMLTIAQLMPLPLPRAFLAVLSACETAKGDRAQPDQAVHLAAAMLFAGFKSVVGTMWSMSDIDGPVVAKKIYERLFEGDSEFLDPDIVPYVLDEAVQQLRAESLHPSRWAPYIHIGI